MKIRFTGMLLLISLFLLSACGLKGPLYIEKGEVLQSSENKAEKKSSAVEANETESGEKSQKKD